MNEEFSGENLRIFRSFSYEALADKLIGNLYARRDTGFFVRHQVIVPNRSTARYLSTRIAQKQGIAAGIDFPFLLSFLQHKVLLLKGENCSPLSGDADPAAWRADINADTIAWRICKLLPELLPEPDFAPLRRYLGEGASDSLRTFRLAQELGKLYDRYMLYRPEWINAWESGLTPEPLRENREALWQGRLWRTIAGTDWAGKHFAAMIRKLQDKELSLHYEGVVRIFGFAAVPPAVLYLLSSLGSSAPVEFYHFLPSKEYIGGARSSREELKEFSRLYLNQEKDPEKLRSILENYYFLHNPLVGSFAAQARVLLNQTIDWNQEELEEPEIAEETILHRLQKKIIDDAAEAKTPAAPPDTPPCPSIQFRSCSSPFREVESARNFLLHCFQDGKIPGLALKDIFIMTPRPELFAPIVDAVFNNPVSEFRLPVSLADRSPEQSHDALAALLKILAIHKDFFTISSVFAIFRDQEILKHLGLTREDCLFCEERAAAAGIRWGWDAEEHRLSGGVPFPECSWSAGFDRLLLGYAMETEEDMPFGYGIFGVPGFSGQRAQILGKFIRFAENLHQVSCVMREHLTRGASFAFWKEFLIKTAGTFFGPESGVSQLLFKGVKKWESELRIAGTSDFPLCTDVVLRCMENLARTAEDSAGGFLRGKITFCGMRPMRSIPAKVIVLLGMNHDAFPTSEPDLEFNLMRRAPQGGDPRLRDDERQLFLDLLLSARDALCFTYTGRSSHDSKTFPPSACVEELRMYMERTFGANSFVSLREPLQAFAPELFKGDGANRSFSTVLCQAAKLIGRQGKNFPALHTGALPGEIPPEFLEIDLKQLAAFFREPCIYFAEKRLGISGKVKEKEAPPDVENFTAEWMDFSEKERLYQLLRGKTDKEELRSRISRKLKSDGTLPLYCTETFAEFDEIAAIAQAIPEDGAAIEPRTLLFDCSGNRKVTLKIPEFTLGTDGELYHKVFAKFGAGTMVSVILNHIGANLSTSCSGTAVAADGKYRIKALTQEEAHDAMKDLIELYLQGMQEPLVFFPKTSYACFSGEKWKAVWTGRNDSAGEREKFVLYTGSELPEEKTLAEYAGRFFGKLTFEAIPGEN